MLGKQIIRKRGFLEGGASPHRYPMRAIDRQNLTMIRQLQGGNYGRSRGSSSSPVSAPSQPVYSDERSSSSSSSPPPLQDVNLGSELGKRARRGFLGFVDRVGQTVSEKIIPAVLERAIDLVIGRINQTSSSSKKGPPLPPRSKVVSGGSIDLASLAREHGFHLPPAVLQKYLKDHRKGREKQTKNKIISLMLE